MTCKSILQLAALAVLATGAVVFDFALRWPSGTVVYAADTTKDKISGLTVEEVSTICVAMRAGMDSYQRVVKDGTKETVIVQAFSFSPGMKEVLFNDEYLACKVLAGFQVDNKALDAVWASRRKNGNLSDEDQAIYDAARRKILDEKTDVMFDPISIAGLKLSENPILQSVLSNLKPLLIP